MQNRLFLAIISTYVISIRMLSCSFCSPFVMRKDNNENGPRPESSTKNRMSVSNDEISRIISNILKSNNNYEILNVKPNSTESEIKDAFRKLTFLIHPNKCRIKDCEEAFKKVLNAKECLLNKKKGPEPKTYTYTQYGTNPFDHINRFNHVYSDFYNFSYMYGNSSFFEHPEVMSFSDVFYNVRRMNREQNRTARYNTDLYKFLLFIVLFLLFFLNLN